MAQNIFKAILGTIFLSIPVGENGQNVDEPILFYGINLAFLHSSILYI